MRKVTQKIVSAFIGHYSATLGNTHTDGTTLWLHGNAIAQWRDGDLWVTNAGWFTATTKERLNGIAGVSISQKRGQWYLNGKQWDGEWVSVQDWNDKQDTTPSPAVTFEYELQGRYGDDTEWDTIETVDTLKEAKELLQCYHINELGTPHRIRKVRADNNAVGV